MDDERLRALYSRHTAVHALLRDPPAVPLDAMLDVLERRGPEGTRRETLQRIVADPESLREFELLRAVATASSEEATRPPSHSPRPEGLP
jgi:hypothetical protein